MTAHDDLESGESAFGLPIGGYRAVLTLLRDGQAVFEQTHRLQIDPN